MITTDDLKRFAKVDSYTFIKNNRNIREQFPDLISPDGEDNSEDLVYCSYCGVYEVEEQRELCKACEEES